MLKVTEGMLRCQTWPANTAHCLNDVQTLDTCVMKKKISKYSDDFIVKTLPAIRILLSHSQEGYHLPLLKIPMHKTGFQANGPGP
jgi:hypothetical protein